MSTPVKSIADVAKKWGDVTPGRQAYYQQNASVAGDQWAKQTAAAAPAYQAAIQAANIGQMYKGGVAKAGAAKYNRKVTDVGAARFGPGVTAAIGDYQAGEAPMLDTIASVTPPMRQPRGSQANLARVSAYSTALNMKRAALRAAGK